MKTLILILLSLTAAAMDLTSTLKVEEGLRLSVYLCSKGYPTIGYGHRCSADQKDITKEEAEKILAADIKEAIEGVEKLVGKDQPEQVKKILVTMVFQMGYKGVKGFKNTLRLIRAKDYKGASKEMLDSEWARQDSPARAKRMSDLMAAVK